MKLSSMRQLETPPPELAAMVMAGVREWRRPPQVRWLIGAQTALLAGLLMVSSATLPAQLTATAEVIQEWSVSLAQATLDLSENMDRFLGLEIEGGLL